MGNDHSHASGHHAMARSSQLPSLRLKQEEYAGFKNKNKPPAVETVTRAHTIGDTRWRRAPHEMASRRRRFSDAIRGYVGELRHAIVGYDDRVSASSSTVSTPGVMRVSPGSAGLCRKNSRKKTASSVFCDLNSAASLLALHRKKSLAESLQNFTQRQSPPTRRFSQFRDSRRVHKNSGRPSLPCGNIPTSPLCSARDSDITTVTNQTNGFNNNLAGANKQNNHNNSDSSAGRRQVYCYSCGHHTQIASPSYQQQSSQLFHVFLHTDTLSDLPVNDAGELFNCENCGRLLLDSPVVDAKDFECGKIPARNGFKPSTRERGSQRQRQNSRDRHNPHNYHNNNYCSTAQQHYRRMSVDNIALVSQHHHDHQRAQQGELPPTPAAQPRRYSRVAKLSQSGREELLNNFRRFSKPKNDIGDDAIGDDMALPPAMPAGATVATASATVEFGMYLSEILKLSSYQTMILQQTWPKIKPTVFNNVLKQLSNRNATARELFQKMSIVEGFSSTKKCFDQREHHRMLVDLFDTCIHELNMPANNILEKCARFGEQHYTLCGGGNSSKLWDDMGDCLTEVLAKADGVRGKREAFRAWILLIAFLIDSIKANYLALCKRKSVCRLSNGQIAAAQLSAQLRQPPRGNFVSDRRQS